MAKTGTISIACASAFWGDTSLAVEQLLTEPRLDFIAFDYLSEVTMALLARAQKKDPALGFAADFLSDVIEPHLRQCLDRGIKLVSNAGGINSPALMKKIAETAARLGVKVKVICVAGDDLRGSPSLSAEQRGFATANAYLGASGVVQALAAGADIVLTGRTVDTALVSGPLIHAFGQSFENFDFLAQASLAGHILECGTQATGGNFTDWPSVPGKDNVGFPIARFEASGRFTVTKAPGTGGLVTPPAVTEQIVYEIGDPKNYILPDVICDFSAVQVKALNANEVSVEGAKGRAPTSTYKVSATRQKGWRVSTTAFIGGGDAVAKARSVGEAILTRVARAVEKRGWPAFTETRLETLGGGEQALMRLSAANEKPEPLDLLAKEIAPSGTSLAPGIANLLGGRAQAVPRMAFSSFLIDKSSVEVFLTEGAGQGETRTAVKVAHHNGTNSPGEPFVGPAATPRADDVTVKLERIAFARSGDKGNHVNIGVIARSPELFTVLQAVLTPAQVAGFFKDDFDRETGGGKVEAWAMPGLHALNFLLHDCLGGGGSYSLRVDPQGKAFAQRLLQMPVRVPKGAL